VITSSNLKEFAGPPNYLTDKLYEVNPVGVATGLAYSSHGGAVLFIESAIADATPRSLIPQGHTLEAEEEEHDDPTRRYDEDQDEEEEDEDDDSLPHTRHNPVRSHAPSRGDLFCTGQMGSVMKESSAIAYTVAKRVLHQRTLPTSSRRAFFEQHRIHLHLPHGATPKDGPSAGIAMVTSLLSLALGVAPRRAHAMTGELSLTGKVHPIGGVKEKLMSAKHAGIELVVLPRQNQRDVDELKPYVIEGLDIHYADSYDEVFELIFPEWKERATSAAAATLPASLAASLPAAANSSSLPAAL
jgi:ATP-dependent Lon protease